MTNKTKKPSTQIAVKNRKLRRNPALSPVASQSAKSKKPSTLVVKPLAALPLFTDERVASMQEALYSAISLLTNSGSSGESSSPPPTKIKRKASPVTDCYSPRTKAKRSESITAVSTGRQRSAQCAVSGRADSPVMAEQAAHLAGMAFIPYYNQIMKILECDQSLKRTIVGMAKQMGYAAAGAACGGAVGGPPGAMIGGIAGSLYGYMHADDYTALITVLKEMSDLEKRRMVEKVQELVGSTGIEALVGFVGQQVNRELFAKLIQDFAKSGSKGA